MNEPVYQPIQEPVVGIPIEWVHLICVYCKHYHGALATETEVLWIGSCAVGSTGRSEKCDCEVREAEAADPLEGE